MAKTSELDPDSARELSTQLALLAVESAAPDEVLMFEEVTEEYFEDPAATLTTNQREESVGFGLDLVLLTPYALAVSQFVLGFLIDLLMDGAKDVAKPGVVNLIRRILRRPGQEAASEQVPDWTPEQRQRILTAATDEATRLGLAEDHAALLGKAIVGALVTRTG